MSNRIRLQEDSILENRLAARLAGGLTRQLDSTPRDISERLRFAREKAVIRAGQVRHATVPAMAIVGIGMRGASVLGSFMPWWQRAVSFLPLVVLVVGFLAIDHWAVREQVVAAADFDSQLLADDLPPSAYSDPGFAEFLRSPPTP